MNAFVPCPETFVVNLCCINNLIWRWLTSFAFWVLVINVTIKQNKWIKKYFSVREIRSNLKAVTSFPPCPIWLKHLIGDKLYFDPISPTAIILYRHGVFPKDFLFFFFFTQSFSIKSFIVSSVTVMLFLSISSCFVTNLHYSWLNCTRPLLKSLWRNRVGI